MFKVKEKYYENTISKPTQASKYGWLWYLVLSTIHTQKNEMNDTTHSL